MKNNGRCALIAGATGQCGSYLAEFLLEKGYKVIALKRRTSSICAKRIENIYNHPNFHVEYFDLNDAGCIWRLFMQYEPDEVYNLAAQSQVRVSFDVSENTVDGIAMGTLRMLNAMKEIIPHARFYQASSSEMFGDTIDEPPFNENTRMMPASPYAAAKLCAHNFVRNYREAYDLHCSSGILFNNECFFWNTPVLLRKNNEINFQYISSLVRNRKNVDKDNAYEEKDYVNSGTEIWDGNKFVELKTVSRKKLSKLEKKFRKRRIVVTPKGMSETTPNHKLISRENEKIPSHSCKEGDRLRIGSFPSFNLIDNNKECGNKFAKLLGLLCGDGHVSSGRIRLTNSDKTIEEELRHLVKSVFCNATIRRSEYKSGFNGKTVHLDVKGLSGNYCNYLRELLYDKKTSHKKVPKLILNSDLQIQEAFLEGYYLADGLKFDKTTYKFKSFLTNSPLLAQGLLLLVVNVTGQTFNINSHFQNGKIYYKCNLHTPNDVGAKGQHLRNDPDVIKKIEEFDEENQHVFDIETGSGVLMAGVGNLIVGNSPRRGETFVTRKITRAAARIKLGLQEYIELGNLDAKRDWGFTNDYCKAIWMMLQKEEPDDYVIATGEMHSVKEFLETVFEHAEIDNPMKYVRYNPKYLRPHEVPLLVGDASKAKKKLGWKPNVNFRELAKMMYEHDFAELLNRVEFDEENKVEKEFSDKIIYIDDEDDESWSENAFESVECEEEEELDT